MKAVIPVAGLGTRLRPHTLTTPKPLLEVAGKPILAHILDELVDSVKVDEVTFIVHYFAEAIEKWVRDKYKFKANFVYQEKLLGLGHAIKMTEDYHRNNESVLIILGDTIFEADLGKIIKMPENSIGVKSVEDPRRFGIVELEGDKVIRLMEKPEVPPTNLAIVGIYHITAPKLMYDCLQEIMDENKTTKGEFQLTDALQKMLEKGADFKSFEIEGWFDCGKPETMLETNRALLEKKHADEYHADLMERFPDAVLIPPVAISHKADIRRSVIGPYVSIAEESIIEDAIIRNSIISAGAKVSEMLMEDSLVGENARTKNRFICLNISDFSDVNIG